MKKRIFYLSLLVMIGLCPHKSLSQHNPLELYNSNIQTLPELYNGGEYVNFPTHFEGHPYFYSKSFHTAELVYNDVLYDNVMMLYDLVNHHLITFNVLHHTNIIIQSNGVTRFTIRTKEGDFNFVRHDITNLKKDKRIIFLEEIIQGKADFYCLYEKTKKEKIDHLDRFIAFDATEKYFIRHMDNLYPINKKGDLIRLLSLNKKIIKMNLKQDGVKFRNNEREYFSKVINKYNNSEL